MQGLLCLGRMRRAVLYLFFFFFLCLFILQNSHPPLSFSSLWTIRFHTCRQWGGWLAEYHHQLVERLKSPLAKDQWTIFVVGEMKEQEELPSSSRRQFPTYCVTTGRSRTGPQCARHGLRDGGKQQVDKDRTVPCYSQQPWDPSSFSMVTSINTNKLLRKSQFQYVYIYLSQM